ncbi:Calx-beta domain-containing protein, partial [Candidatus Palauibacter soopunensis]|uniref:Calx-beta domain-containing protein n=1 Tax=Candidatus Palauibacter soopunensis TaxID=3056739 RepID=UPI00239D1C17
GTGANGFDHPDLGTNLGRIGADPHPTRNRFAVAVREGDGTAAVPTVTVSAGATVTEGGGAQFTVSASPAPTADLTVNLTVADDGPGDFVASTDEGDDTVVIKANQASAPFTVATVDDTIDEADGAVAVRVAASKATPADYAVGTRARASVTVRDDDGAATAPAVTVSAGAAVTEGGDAQFTVSASPAPTADLTVNLTVSDDATGDFVASADEGAKEVIIRANRASATFTVATVDDETDEADGAVRISIAASQATPADYAVGDPASASVTVRDDDVTIQTVTVAAGDAVTEGGDARFTLTAVPAPAADLTVRFTVDDGVGEDFVEPGQEGSKAAVIPAGAASVAWTVATVDDQTDEADGAVRLTIQDSGGYVAGSPASASVPVKDDDDPVVTVAAGGAVTEGGDALFTLTAVRAPAAPLAVSVTVAADGEYGVAAGRRTVSIPTTGSAVLTLATADDEADELDGAVSVTVTAGRGYRPGEPASATVAVRDDDEPVVTIAARAASVTEGDDARFAVTADRSPARALTVALIVSETGAGDHVAAASEGPASVTLASGATGATFALATVYDGVDEPDSVAVVTVQAGGGYAVGSPASASVTVRDGGAAPALSVADMTVPESSEFAGETVSLRYLPVRLSGQSGREVTVRVDTRPSTPVSARAREDYWPIRGRTVTFRAGQTQAQVPFLIYDDSHDEGAETFEFVLSGPVGATIGAGVAVVTITNDDPMPAAWLSRFGRTVAQQALDGIAGRMAAPRSPGMQGALAGQAVGFGPTESPGSGSPGSGSGAGGAGGTPAAGETPGTAPANGEAALAMAGIARGFGNEAGGTGSGGVGPGHDIAGFGTPLSPQSRAMTARDALLGSSFSLTGEKDGSGGSMAFWGRAAQARFDGREGTFSLDGTATTAMLGADYARGRWLIGLALAQSDGEGDYRDTDVMSRAASQDCPAEAAELCRGAVREGDGTVEASLTAAVPYAAFQASERLKLWGAAGYGTGEVTLKTELGGRYKADTSWSMAAAGMRGDLLEAPAEGGPALAVTSDALWTQTSSEKTRDLAASDSDVTR